MIEQIERAGARMELAPADRRRMARALATDYEAFLAPGERFEITGAAGAEYVWAKLALARPDRSLRLELEAAAVAGELGLGEDREALALLFDFLRVQLYEFFRQDRRQRFHSDWRAYPFEGHTIRSRGELTRPALEAQADELLAQADDEALSQEE